MAENNPPFSAIQPTHVNVVQNVEWRYPVPPPQILGDYTKIIPTAAERIMAIYEKEVSLTEESARVYFGGNKKYVAFVKGETFMDNKWELRDIVQDESTATVKVSCLKCGHVFDARARDVKAGHGRYCSRSCSGASRGQPRAVELSLARPEEAAQMALL